jgi:hypothetical protein
MLSKVVNHLLIAHCVGLVTTAKALKMVSPLVVVSLAKSVPQEQLIPTTKPPQVIMLQKDLQNNMIVYLALIKI